jgi:hypothetical protein
VNAESDITSSCDKIAGSSRARSELRRFDGGGKGPPRLELHPQRMSAERTGEGVVDRREAPFSGPFK